MMAFEWILTHLGNLVKLAEQFVEHNDQLLGRAVAGQSSEADNVSIKNTERKGTQYLMEMHIIDQSTDVLDVE